MGFSYNHTEAQHAPNSTWLLTPDKASLTHFTKNKLLVLPHCLSFLKDFFEKNISQIVTVCKTNSVEQTSLKLTAFNPTFDLEKILLNNVHIHKTPN